MSTDSSPNENNILYYKPEWKKNHENKMNYLGLISDKKSLSKSAF